MSFSVIDGLHLAAKGYIAPELGKFGQNSEEEYEQQQSLEKLIEPLNPDLAEKIQDCVSELTSATAFKAFQNGFQMAAHLMVECLNSRNTVKRR